jgi:hypothetical protein
LEQVCIFEEFFSQNGKAHLSLERVQTLGFPQFAFAVGCLMALAASLWFFIQSIEGRNAVYMAAILTGCGGSIMLATSLSMIAELIGQDKVRSSFIKLKGGFILL